MTFVLLPAIPSEVTIVIDADRQGCTRAEVVALLTAWAAVTSNLRKGYIGSVRRHLRLLGPWPFGKENDTCLIDLAYQRPRNRAARRRPPAAGAAPRGDLYEEQVCVIGRHSRHETAKWTNQRASAGDSPGPEPGHFRKPVGVRRDRQSEQLRICRRQHDPGSQQQHRLELLRRRRLRHRHPPGRL